MLINKCWLMLSYRHVGIREASLSFALSSAAGGALAPTHLVAQLTRYPPQNWGNFIDCVDVAEEIAVSQSTDSTHYVMMFQRTEIGIFWETTEKTVIRLWPDNILETCWPIRNDRYTNHEDQVNRLEESVWRRALSPLGYPDSVGLCLEMDDQPVHFALPMANLAERVISLVNRIPEEGFYPPEYMIPGILDGDVVSLLAALDSWEESREVKV